MTEETVKHIRVICGLCRYAKKADKLSYYGRTGYHCKFGVIPEHYVLDEKGTCKDGEFAD